MPARGLLEHPTPDDKLRAVVRIIFRRCCLNEMQRWSLERGRCNLIRRIDFALFMVEAFENDELVHEDPGDRRPPDASALAHAANDLNSSVALATSRCARGNTRDGQLPSAKSCEPEGHRT